ncbi:MAG: peptidase S9, partial [Fibrobacter sp.]|nr:peptidase S9 [Fibrobacter sp.]
MIKVIITLLIFLSANISGQYFGRNKVRYENFKFKVLSTPSFKIHFYKSEEDAVRNASEQLEIWNKRFQKLFGNTLPENQPIILYANHADFQQTNAIGGLISQDVGGVTEGFLNRVIIPLTGIQSENDHVLGHELVHAFQYQLLRGSEAGISGGDQIPLWFIEGMAEYLSSGSSSALSSMWIRDAVLHDKLPTITMIGEDAQYFPYRYGHVLWAYIGGRFGDNSIVELFNSVLQLGWYRGFENTLGKSIDTLSIEWQNAVKRKYSQYIQNRTKPSELGTLLLKPGDMNLSPVVSPDGSKFVFFSARDLFTIDLFLADTSGKITQKIVTTETDAHFDALRFINSAASWSPDGERVAFSVFKKGDNAISIFNVKKRRTEKTIEFDTIDAVYNLAWSPDGRKILISGTAGGICDLYLLDINSGSVERITNDFYAELQPVWAPDGRSIAFATDRDQDSSAFPVFSPMKIAILNLGDHNLRFINIAPWAKHINPLFSSDGDEIFFVSDPDGFSDIYRYNLESGECRRVSNIATGICGLTELSPTMSIAPKTGTLIFSLFNNQSYEIHRLERSALSGTEFTIEETDYLSAVKLPPAESKNSIVDKYLDTSVTTNLTIADTSITRYKPRLKLLYVGQLFAGVAANTYGVGFAGGVSFLFSDLLGDHSLGVSTQINGGIRDFGGEVYYLNQGHRLNWGVVASRIPYVVTSASVRNDTAIISGTSRNVQKFTFLDEHIYSNQLYLLMNFPFTINRRLEFTAGFSRIGYDYQAEEITAQNGIVLRRQRVPFAEPSSVNLLEGGVAYVGDFSYFGFTSPVTGRRYRFELQQTTGSLLYSTILADYRQYIFFNPLTLAFRFFHYGRYLRDCENERLSEIFLGYETLIRGYSSYSYDLAGCSDSTFGDCPEFNRLQGSRIGVFNMELRIPLLGTDRFG